MLVYDVLSQLGCNPIDCGSYIKSSCPIHLGDNPGAFVYWKDGGWKCFSRGCEEKYGRTITGLIRYLKEIHGDRFQHIQHADHTEYDKPIVVEKRPIYWSNVVASFGYTKQFCKKYEIGGLLTKNQHTFAISYRIYDRQGQYKGHTYRLLDGYRQWLLQKTGEIPPKWKHSKGLRCGRVLYGEKFIDRSLDYVIVTEGAKDAAFLWKCGIKNVVASLGLGLRTLQENILIDLGIYKIKYFLDNDDAANIYYDSNRYKRTACLFDIENLSKKLPVGCDPDDVSPEQLQEILA
jgi:hypothetical protein